MGGGGGDWEFREVFAEQYGEQKQQGQGLHHPARGAGAYGVTPAQAGN
jgi:hypothetical protein